jgi:hypothetical protein
MLRYLGLLSLPLLLLSTPASAITNQEKMETCKIGAESQHLTGAKQKAFINRCMAKGNYEPPARRATAKTKTKKSAGKKPAVAPATAPAPAAKKP